jgi:hypothetical protein
MIFQCIDNLNSLKNVLTLICDDEYSMPLDILSGSSIGQHCRHILEFFTALTVENCNLINYDKRSRNKELESSILLANSIINVLIKKLEMIEADRSLLFQSDCTEFSDIKIQKTSLFRELTYCLDHSIHHQALIKVGLIYLNKSKNIDFNFGVAASTLKYKSGIKNKAQ